MNGTISIKPFILYSLPFSSTLPWDELALYGRRLEWVEPRTNLPPHPLTKQASEHCHYFKIMWHLYYDPPRRDRECNRSQDIHWFARCRYFKLLLRSMELRWNVRLVKKVPIVPENTLLTFKGRPLVGTLRIPVDKKTMSVRIYGSDLINIILKMTEILALSQSTPCHQLAPVSPTVCLMLIQLSAKKRRRLHRKKWGGRPPGLKKWGVRTPPTPCRDDPAQRWHRYCSLVPSGSHVRLMNVGLEDMWIAFILFLGQHIGIRDDRHLQKPRPAPQRRKIRDRHQVSEHLQAPHEPH